VQAAAGDVGLSKGFNHADGDSNSLHALIRGRKLDDDCSKKMVAVAIVLL
jgi:hypothetical protein